MYTGSMMFLAALAAAGAGEPAKLEGFSVGMELPCQTPVTPAVERALREIGIDYVNWYVKPGPGTPDEQAVAANREMLAFARRAVQSAGGDVPMFGLAKRLEEIWLPDAKEPILLDRHSPALHLIQRLRDEAHRFAITHHRGLRAKQSVRSKLEDIPGVGPKRRAALLKRFKSMEALKAASMEEIADAPGMSRPTAEAVHRFLHGQEQKQGI